ncbi:cytidylate kinase [Lacrimispora xylanisolvens]|uniref:Cytidylate kinase n=1 Tax=Lacrimispora xylanisolvens TaxID=384636 RepID=A0A2S6HSY3_9FIRM|nr:cytidylate kinase-like family protein [Hungatella xylanolytica]MBE5988501.1 cytidylate kinase-like family protein [Paenibacillaceae bacterium]MTK09649.1 cytidylate kinase-like family protein [Hungatella sp.]PPK80869.1 cytidylate kinase [Hungatella xylanolytica]
MKEKFVVTITRQFGSLGRPIARMVSENLGIEYYDRDIVEMTSKDLNLPVSAVSDVEESAKSAFFNMNYPLGMGTTSIQDSVFAVQKKIIVDLAERESCIIVGRCADHILEDYKNIIHIFIYAPYEARLKNCVERLNMRPDEAKKMIASVDKARESYHRHYCGYVMSDKEHKHVMIDSSLLGVEGTCEILTEIIRKRFSNML